MAGRYESVFRAGLFEGKTVLVTGGGTGIGRCTAHELAALGANVVIAARRLELLEKTAAEIIEAGGRCDTAQLNIRDEKAVDTVVAGIVGKHGRIDGLVNNAGGQFVQPAAKISPNGWRTVIDLILNGTFLMSSAVYRHSMQQHGGSIVNMLADVWTGYPGMAHMAAARAGLANLGITLSMEWAASDVRVNAVAPGTILSSGMRHYPREIQELTVAEVAESTPARLGTESEVSAAIVFLLSPGAAYVTGVTLEVDGGQQFQKGRLVKLGHHPGSTRFDGFHLKPDFSGTPFASEHLEGALSLAERIAAPLRRFLAIETASSLLLVAATMIALAAANSPWREGWAHFWHQRVALEVGSFELALSLGHWVNDGLMAVFFFVVGLEIKRELTIGELASREKAMLPVFGALGGMVVPAGIYLLLQPGGEAAAGWGIPMATDIAFAVAALTLLGPRVSPGLKVFLLALAIVDDLGAVTVIALFYTEEIQLAALGAAALGLGAAYAMRAAGVRAYGAYLAMGALVWLATLSSGIHATVAGVLLGLLTPVHAVGERETLIERMRERAREALDRIGSDESSARAPDGLLEEVRGLALEAQSPLEYLTHRLHPFVAFFVLPVFALANAGVSLDASTLGDPAGAGVALAVAAGLLLGKPLGIALFALAAVRLRIAVLPAGVGTGALFGAGLLGGIGFTMALFITALAFGETPLAAAAKVGVLAASLLACVGGLWLLARALPPGD